MPEQKEVRPVPGGRGLKIDLSDEAARWDQAFISERLRQSDPDASVIRFVQLNLGKLDGRLLDLGCGYGRHLTYFAERQYRSVGIDLSAKALRGAQGRLRAAGISSASLVRADFAHLPLADSSFVGGVSIRVIYHGTRKAVLAALSEIQRVLIPGAEMLVTFLSDRSSHYGRGQPLEDKTFRVEGGVDAGAPHRFFNQTDIQKICAEAGLLLKILRLEEFINDDGHRSSSWSAILRKPKQ